MFKLLKKTKAENQKLVAPADGVMFSIEEVSNPMFAQKLLGDGVELLIHIGIDTVSANGESYGKKNSFADYGKVEQGQAVGTTE